MTRGSVLHCIFWFLTLLVLLLVGCAQKAEPAATGQPSADSSSPEESALGAMQIIEERVSELRGLETLQPAAKDFMTTDELRQWMTDEYSEHYSEQEAHDDVLLYVAFELTEPDLDLYNLLIELQTEQVGGFYDADTEEMYLITRSQEPGALDRWTFSHEYAHVLQDQHFDLQALGFTDEDDDEDDDGERKFAIRALVEGDAYLLMQQYAIRYFDLKELQEVFDQLGGIDSSVLDSAPAIVRESLMFESDAGLVFVTALFEKGGWPAVDAAYANPPLSTEQILHPDRYPDDVPQIVTLPPLTDTLGVGWRLVDEDVVGEFGLRLYLDVHLDPSDAEDTVEVAAEGWDGDRYAVYWRDDESAFVLALRLVWDTPTDAAEFFDTYVQFAEHRFGSGPARAEGDAHLWWFGGDALLLSQNDQGETLILIAPDEATLDAIHALFPGF